MKRAHRPIQAIDRYVREKQIALARSIASRTKVYLDQRYWIIARDAAAGVRTGRSARKLLQFLRRGVRNGTLICPIGASSFLELMKQAHSDSRRIGTARLIDELSLGVTMLPSQSIMGTEIFSCFRERMGQPIHDMQELIWTKAAYVLGLVHPELPELDDETELLILKRIVDEMWEQPLTDIIHALGEVEWPADGYDDLACQVDRANAAHADEIRSFEEAYRHELKGVAELCAPMAAEIAAYLEGRSDEPRQQHDWHMQTWMARLILCELMSRPENRGMLRSLCISVALYAASRWDKKRRFKANDLHDFDHAVCALGYCDAFLTEGPLHHLTSEPRLSLAAINDCRIISDLDEAVDFLRRLPAPSREAR